MDFHLGAAAEELREQAREFLAAELTDPIREEVERTGVHHDPGFHRKLAQKRWIAPAWSVEQGGLGRSVMEVQALAEELQYADAPLHGAGTTRICAGVVNEIGTDWLKAQVIPPFLAGDIVMVQAWTEPECGSDVAASRTRAVRDGADWIIDGAKMFTTNANVGHYALLLARTDPDVPKHRGLTTFLVPLDTPGIEIQPVFTISGERTNVTFYTGVRISDDWRVGDVGGGWNTMTLALTLERSGAFGGELARLRDVMDGWVDERPAGSDDAPVVAARHGRVAAAAEISQLLARRSAWVAQTGRRPGVEGSMAKLYDTEALGAQCAAVVDMLGPDGVRRSEDPTAPLRGLPEHFLRRAVGATIYAGTSEIQRSIIAERGLGLPRGR